MQRVKVWDLAVRLGHWLMAALVLGAFLTSEEDESTPLHVRFGLAILGLVVFRVAWGFFGSAHARFRDFVRSPREVLAYAREYVRGRAGHFVGHNPLGGAMVVALLATLAVVTLTGVLNYLGPEWGGPLDGVLTKQAAHAVKEVHEAAAWTLPVLVAFHVLGVVLSSLLEKQNLVKGMITGWKRGDVAPVAEPSLAARALGFVAAVGLGVGVVLLVWKVMPVAEAEAAAPRPGLAAEYLAEARASDGAFAPDAARGKALYFSEHPKDGKPVSCASCHTPDARAEGRSPAGKRIEPLAPSVNPERFADRAKADKWFDRNCKQVLGRLCTPAEKADFLAYLTSL